MTPFQEKIMLYYMKDHPLFAESLVNELINQYMEDLIPDVLIDAFHEASKGVGIKHARASRVGDSGTAYFYIYINNIVEILLVT